jgi:hypothetical protein
LTQIKVRLFQRHIIFQNPICILWEVDMLRAISVTAILLLIAMQGVARAQEPSDMKASLQGCLSDAMTTGNFDKARMGDRGTLVVHCSAQPAQQMYANLARGVTERNIVFPNRDKGAVRRFGQSTCSTVREKADGSPAAEFSCRIAISVGAAVLESF